MDRIYGSEFRQKAQDNHKHRYPQVLEQAEPDHLRCIYHDTDNWCKFNYQELNNNNLLTASIDFILLVEQGLFSVVDRD